MIIGNWRALEKGQPFKINCARKIGIHIEKDKTILTLQLTTYTKIISKHIRNIYIGKKAKIIPEE